MGSLDSLSSMEGLGMGSVYAFPPVPSSAREAGVVRGPACDGTAGQGMNVPHVTYFYIILLERVE